MKTFTFLVIFSSCALACAKEYTPGVQHNFAHKDGSVPKDSYQYSLWVPKSYKPDVAYPVVVYLHGGRGRFHPDQAKRNMVARTLIDNQNWTNAGYSGNAHGQNEYLHVAPVKPVLRWNAAKFKRMIDHVRSKVNIDENRIYVTGFSMGGQGSWRIGCGQNHGYKIAAMIPIGAWGCNEVRPGKTPQKCQTVKTPTWIEHCPLDHVSLISEQIPLFQNHLDCGGYGRLTMIPGKGHIRRARGEDDSALSMRIAWMLSQTYGTPHNYIVQTDGGVILQMIEGERGFIGDTSKYGFFEPGSVIRLTAPESKDGKKFVKWSSLHGNFADAKNRRTTYKVANNDSQLFAIFEGQAELKVVGGTATPANPKPGETVTVTSDLKGEGVFFWDIAGIDIPHSYKRSVKFCMPSRNVKALAQIVQPERR